MKNIQEKSIKITNNNSHHQVENLNFSPIIISEYDCYANNRNDGIENSNFTFKYNKDNLVEEQRKIEFFNDHKNFYDFENSQLNKKKIDCYLNLNSDIYLCNDLCESKEKMIEKHQENKRLKFIKTHIYKSDEKKKNLDIVKPIDNNNLIINEDSFLRNEIPNKTLKLEDFGFKNSNFEKDCNYRNIEIYNYEYSNKYLPLNEKYKVNQGSYLELDLNQKINPFKEIPNSFNEILSNQESIFEDSKILFTRIPMNNIKEKHISKKSFKNASHKLLNSDKIIKSLDKRFQEKENLEKQRNFNNTHKKMKSNYSYKSKSVFSHSNKSNDFSNKSLAYFAIVTPSNNLLIDLYFKI